LESFLQKLIAHKRPIFGVNSRVSEPVGFGAIFSQVSVSLAKGTLVGGISYWARCFLGLGKLGPGSLEPLFLERKAFLVKSFRGFEVFIIRPLNRNSRGFSGAERFSPYFGGKPWV